MTTTGNLVFGMGLFFILFASAYAVTDDRKEYDCYVDTCNREGQDWQYCDHEASGRKCRYCSDANKHCLTRKMPGNCTTYCTEKLLQREKVKGCGPINQPANGYHNGSNNGQAFGDVIDLQCDSGYRCDGPCTISCIGFGYYSGTLKCAEIGCGPINQTENGHHNGSNIRHKYGNVIVLQCDSGYRCDGPCSISCNGFGYYNGSLKCAENYCQAFLPSKYLKYSPENENYDSGDTVSFKCNEDFTLEGKPTATCMENGSWNIIETPACIHAQQSNIALYTVIGVGTCLIVALIISLISVKCNACTRNAGELKESARSKNESDKERINTKYSNLRDNDDDLLTIDETGTPEHGTSGVKRSFRRQVSRSETDPTLIGTHDALRGENVKLLSSASDSEMTSSTLPSSNLTPTGPSSDDSGLGEDNKKEDTLRQNIELNIKVVTNCSNSSHQSNNINTSATAEGQDGKNKTPEPLTELKPHSTIIDKHPIEETVKKSNECHGELQCDNDLLTSNNTNGRIPATIIDEQEYAIYDTNSKDTLISATTDQRMETYPKNHAQTRDAHDKAKFAIGNVDIPSEDVKKYRN